MDDQRRQELFEAALDGYEEGPDATLRATATGLAAAETARSIVLVEGVSDQIALETLAHILGRDLAAEATVVLPMGGAHGVGRFLTRFGPLGSGRVIAGLCDVGEEGIFRRAIVDARLGTPKGRNDLADLGFHVCDLDLEDELIRAAGQSMLESLFESQGDLGSFRTMQKQPEWRDRPFESQVRRYFGSGHRRKSRYAGLIVSALGADAAPMPLRAALDHVA